MPSLSLRGRLYIKESRERRATMNRLSKRVGLVLLVLLIGTIPVLCGCGEEEAGVAEILIGIEADFTGPSSQTIVEVYQGMKDSLKQIEETDPIEGARIKFLTFDDKLDYARGPLGYSWLKDRGAVMQFYSNPFILATVADRCEQDGTPAYAFVSTQELVDRDWLYTFSGTYQWEAESLMNWILADYWPDQQEGRPPKVGVLGAAGFVSSIVYSTVIHDLLAADPGSFQLVEQTPPMGTTAFAAEITKLKDCDMIIVNTVGSSVPSFMKEARDRGYQGVFIGTGISIMGTWNLVRDALSPEELDGSVVIHTQGWWTDEGSIWADLKQTLRELHPDQYDSLVMTGTWGTGWLTVLIWADVIRKAVAEVGPENVDNVAIRDAMLKVDMTVPGYGEAWKLRQGTAGSNVFYRMYIMREYKKAEDDWFALGDWFLPPVLAG